MIDPIYFNAMKIRLGLAHASDVPTLAAMAGALVENGLPQSWGEGRIRRCLLHHDYVVLVARDGRRIAGFALMEYLDRHAHLALLAVAPAYQGRGIGRSLLEWLEATARTAGTFLIRLEVRAGNLAGRRFYARVGYAEDGLRRAYYAGREDAVRMTRSLAVAQPHAL
jgi:ribosomal-protein-alanine acetyltransferase